MKRVRLERHRRQADAPSMLPAIVKLPGVSVETLIGHESKTNAAKRRPGPKLQ